MTPDTPDTPPHPPHPLVPIRVVDPLARGYAILALLGVILAAVGFGLTGFLNASATNENTTKVEDPRTGVQANAKKVEKAEDRSTSAQRTSNRADEATTQISTCLTRSQNLQRCIRETLPAGEGGKPGAAGAGPTSTEVSRAVARFCRESDCRGVPSISDVTSAVSAYCASRNMCRGATGGPGRDATLTQSQLSSAVTAFCARENCRGQQGSDGPGGATGPSGLQGDGPSEKDIAEEVARYCASNDSCQGPVGPQGAAAEPVPPTQDQVNEGVRVYCDARPPACTGTAPAP